MTAPVILEGRLPPRGGPTACEGAAHPLCASCERRRLDLADPAAPVRVRPMLDPTTGACVNHVHVSVRAIAAVGGA